MLLLNYYCRTAAAPMKETICLASLSNAKCIIYIVVDCYFFVVAVCFSANAKLEYKVITTVKARTAFSLETKQCYY